jgi:flagellar hook protein FlgE
VAGSVVVTNGAFDNTKTYSHSAIAVGDTTVTITDSEGGIQTLNLQTPATTAVAASTTPIAFTPATMGGTTVTPVTASSTKPAILTLSDGSTITQTSGTYVEGYSQPFTTILSVYDSLGNVHNLPVYFTKTSVDSVNGNSWTVSLNPDGSATKILEEEDGSLTTVTMGDTGLRFNLNGKYVAGNGTATLTLTNGSKGTPTAANTTNVQSVSLDLTQLTQFSGNNTVNGTTNGNAAGTLESISIDSSGVITGTYTNGQRQTEAQVAVAQFTNASGLTKTGNSLYQESNNSGTANVKTAADLGVTITPSALEMSNVDVANEFADMIITQRGFQSNSKIVTVGDEMLETVINMKR